MQQQEKEAILSAPEIQGLTDRLSAAGAPVSTILNEALAKATENMNPEYRIVVEIVKECLLTKLAQYEKPHEPKKWLGRVIKKLFG